MAFLCCPEPDSVLKAILDSATSEMAAIWFWPVILRFAQNDRGCEPAAPTPPICVLGCECSSWSLLRMPGVGGQETAESCCFGKHRGVPACWCAGHDRQGNPATSSANGGGHRLERQDEMTGLEVGDTVLHPIYGAGTLVSIEKRGKDGTTTDYYIIELLQGKGRLLTPVDKLDELGIRKPVARKERRELAKVFSGRPRKLSEDYRKRRTVIDQRLRDGSFVEVGRVVRDLSWVESQGRFTTGDRRMLQRAKELLAKELAASDGISEEEALGRIVAALERRPSASGAKSA